MVDERSGGKIEVGRYGDRNDGVVVRRGKNVVDMLVEEGMGCRRIMGAVSARGVARGVGSFERYGGSIGNGVSPFVVFPRDVEEESLVV